MFSPNAAGFSRIPQFPQHAQSISEQAAVVPLVQRVIGGSNPALTDLQHRRGDLSRAQRDMVSAIEQFQSDRNRGATNAGLGFCPVGIRMQDLPLEASFALQRRASFLLNKEAIDGFPAVLQEVRPEAGGFGVSNATVCVSALIASVKSQCEQVNSTAVSQAQQGRRVCPTTLQPARLASLVSANIPLFQQMTQACTRSGAVRDATMKPLLHTLATAYFALAKDHPGAPHKPPHEITLTVGSNRSSHVSENWRGNKIANLCIDTSGIDSACASMQPHIALQPPQMQFNATLLQGFEKLAPEKKRAALYIQMLLHEASEIQECMGAGSVERPDHGLAAQRAAQYTTVEWQYPGMKGLGDSVQPDASGRTKRHADLAQLLEMPLQDVQFHKQFGQSMVTDPRVHAWLHSPQFPADLRALAEPSARLLLQVGPATGAALQKLALFRS